MYPTFFTSSIFMVICWVLVFSNTASACELSMGYRSTERLPLISQKPNNSGLYYSLYTLAAEKIGCTLKVVREPKKRIINDLYSGKVDFYPGFMVTKSRAQSVFYIENGLPGKNIGVSRSDLKEVTDLTQLKGLTYIKALGSPRLLGNVEGVAVRQIRQLSVERAILLIQRNRGDFFIYNQASINYYINRHNVIDIKIHPNCCGGEAPLYLGFSKKSRYAQTIKNPKYRPQQVQSIFNLPTIIAPSSVAYQFQQALKQLKTSGVTKKLYARYYQ